MTPARSERSDSWTASLDEIVFRRSEPPPDARQVEAALLADGRELIERMCGSTRYRHLYPEGPNLALLVEAYQELDRARTVGRVRSSRRAHRRYLRKAIRDAVRRDVLDRNRRLSYRYPTPRYVGRPQQPAAVTGALSRIDPEHRAGAEALVSGAQTDDAQAAKNLRVALLGELFENPEAITALHPQYRVLVTSDQPTRRRHPIAGLLLVKLPLQLVLLALTLFNVAYIGAYYFFNDEVLGRFISTRVSSILDGDLEIGSIHWEGRLIFDLITGTPTPAVVKDVTVWEPYKTMGHDRERMAAHADRVEATLVLHEIIPWNRIGIPAVFEIPWILHFGEVRIEDSIWFDVRGYTDVTDQGETVELIGLVDAFQLYDFDPPDGARGLSFWVEDAIMNDTSVELDFMDGPKWRTAATFDQTQFRLQFEAPYPWQGKPVELPLRFALSGQGATGVLQLDDLEVPFDEGLLEKFDCGVDGLPLADIHFAGIADAAGSRVHADGMLGDALRRTMIPEREPLPLEEKAKFGERATVALDAATSDLGPLADHLEPQLGLQPEALSADGVAARARIEGPLSDPTYHLAIEGMTIDLFDQPAWAADEVYLSLMMEQTEVPEQWRDRFEPGTERKVVTFDTLRGSVLEGEFKQREMAEAAQVVMPEEGEPWLIRADLDLAGVDPGQLVPDDPEASKMLAGTARGSLRVRDLVVGPPPPGPDLAPDAEPESELMHADLDFEDISLVRERGPKDDGVPREIQADGRVEIADDGAIDIDDLLLTTDGTRLRVDGGVDGDVEVLRSTLLDLDIDDGRAFARAFDLPHYFDKLRADMTLLGPIAGPDGRRGRLSVAGVKGSTEPTDAEIWMDNGELHVRAPNAHLFGGVGTVQLDARIFEGGGLSSDPKVRAYIDLDGLEIAQVVDGGPAGRVDVELTLDDGDGNPARMSSIRAHGLVTADELELAGTEVHDVALAFRATAEEVAIDRLTLRVHHPVSPRYRPDLTVPIGELVASGTISLDDDPALDLAVQAEGIPLPIVAGLMELEFPVHGKIDRGTDLDVGGRLSRPFVEGTVALAGVSAQGIPLGAGKLEFASEDFDAQGPLAAHRELRVRGELGTSGSDKIQWTVDSVVAIGHARRSEKPPVAAQLDVAFDQIAIPKLLRDPLEPDAVLAIDGRVSGVRARVLTCSPGAPMLSDCISHRDADGSQSLSIKLSVDEAWVRGAKDRTAGDPCNSATTLCSRGGLLASLDWPMVRLDRPWKLATGGEEPVELELRGSFDLSEPPGRSDDAPAVATAACRAPGFVPLPTGAPTGAGGRGDARIEGTLDFASLAPLLRPYGLESASGKLEVDLAIVGHLLAPKVRGFASLPADAKSIAVDLEDLPFPLEFEELAVQVRDGWLLAKGEIGVLGEPLRFGAVDGNNTGYAITGPCAGHFAVAAQGVVGHRLIANLTHNAELTPGGAVDVPRLVAAGHVGDDGVQIQRLDGRVELAEHTLELNPTEGLSDVELTRGRIDFERCGLGTACADAEVGAIALYVGGKEAAGARTRPAQALHARIGRRGETWLWGRTFLSADFARVSDTRLAIRLEDVPYRGFDPTGTLVYEAELTSKNLHLVGGSPLVLHGNVDVDRARYVKDAVQGVEILRLTDEVEIPEAPPPEVVRGLQFDVRVETQRPLRVENNVASGVEAVAVVDIGGSYEDPDFVGRLDVEPGGEVDIPFVTGTFQIQRGRVTLIRDIEDAEVDVLALRQEPIYIDGQPRQIQLLLSGTVSGIRWSCISQGADATAELETVRGCTEYLVLGAGDVQVTENDVQRVGGGGLANARKPLQVVGHLTEFDIGKRAEEAAPRYRSYVPEMHVRLGQVGPEAEIATPEEWFDFDWGRATLGWDYTRGYPGFLLRQSREAKFRFEVLDSTSVEFSRRTRDYLNERIIFDPLEQVTLELRFDFQIPSLR